MRFTLEDYDGIVPGMGAILFHISSPETDSMNLAVFLYVIVKNGKD